MFYLGFPVACDKLRTSSLSMIPAEVSDSYDVDF